MRQLVLLVAMFAVGLEASAASRFVPLGLPGSNYNDASAISDDGTVVAGMMNFTTGAWPYIWTEEAGVQQIAGSIPGGQEVASVLGISGDGLTVFGKLSNAFSYYKWSAQNGFSSIFSGLSEPPRDISYDGSKFALHPNVAISADGSIATGTKLSPNGGVEAYREMPMDCGCPLTQWLGDLPGGDFASTSAGLNSFGGIVVGSSSYGYFEDPFGQVQAPMKAFWWSEANGINALSDWYASWPVDLSDTGQVVIGNGAPLPGSAFPFRWTRGQGMQTLWDLLLAEGIDVKAAGWDVEASIYAASTNGRFFVGTGLNPSGYSEAFLVELDIPGDFDGNGPVDGLDLLKWQRDDLSEEQFVRWLGNFWSPLTPLASASAEAVPEPAAALLALAALALPGALRRRWP